VLKHIQECFKHFSSNLKTHALEAVTHKQICHLKTDLTAQWNGVTSLNDMIKKLHPTPALGSYPKVNRNLRLLNTWRDKTATHPFFGAPIGVTYGDQAKILVAIRNLIFQNDELLLHSGCGIVQQSNLQSEWNELMIKRGAVRAMFSI
jgi:menaquinone-specific isochorismate synthase